MCLTRFKLENIIYKIKTTQLKNSNLNNLLFNQIDHLKLSSDSTVVEFGTFFNRELRLLELVTILTDDTRHFLQHFSIGDFNANR